MTLTPEQLQLRKNRIGASEIAALVGMSSWSTPASVWAEKMGLDAFEGNPFTEWGSTCEPAIAAWYAKENNLLSMASEWSFDAWLQSASDLSALVPCGSLVHPEDDWALATPDRLVVIDGAVQKIVQIKTSQMASEWGEPGTDVIPDAYLCQVTWEMWLCRATFGPQIDTCDVAVSICGRPPVTYVVAYDEAFLQTLRAAGLHFVNNHLLPGVEPPLDYGHAVTQEYIRRKFNRTDGSTIRSEDVDTDELAIAIHRLAVAQSIAKRDGEALRAQMRTIIGPATRIEGPNWSATCNPVRGDVDWHAVAAEAGISKALIEKHRKPPSRRLRFAFGASASAQAGVSAIETELRDSRRSRRTQ